MLSNHEFALMLFSFIQNETVKLWLVAVKPKSLAFTPRAWSPSPAAAEISPVDLLSAS